jgi:excisionase family DNA binding protein
MEEPRREPYTIEEVGKKLRVGRNQAYEAVRRGEIPHFTIGRRKLVPAPAFDRLLETGFALRPSSPDRHPKAEPRGEIGPKENGASSERTTEPALPQEGDRVKRQRLQRLMMTAVSEAEGDPESALDRFVAELFRQADRAELIWSLLSRGRADALRRLFDRVSAEPPAPASPPRRTRRADARGPGGILSPAE